MESQSFKPVKLHRQVTINTGQRKKKIAIWEAKEERKKAMRERKKFLRRQKASIDLADALLAELAKEKS